MTASTDGNFYKQIEYWHLGGGGPAVVLKNVFLNEGALRLRKKKYKKWHSTAIVIMFEVLEKGVLKNFKQTFLIEAYFRSLGANRSSIQWFNCVKSYLVQKMTDT